MSLLEQVLLALLVLDLLAVLGLAAFIHSGSRATHSRTAGSGASPSSRPSAAASISPSATPSPPAYAKPPARSDAAMAYDGASNQLVLFGGQSAGRPLSDTWSWDGHGWTHLDVAGPSARYGASLAYDSARQVLVLVGGFGSTWLSDTWEWDGSHWSQLSPPIHPKPRAFAEMAFDQRTGRMVLVGGQSTITYVSTWTWDGSNWTLQNARTNPPGRHQGGIAYDAARGAVVLYGGSLPGIRRSDCWTWNGSGWTSGGAGPAAGWTGLAWDGAANELIGLVAQNLDSASSTNALITGHAGAWSEASAAAAPPYRSGASVAYDDSVGRVVVFGGVLASGADTNETWLTDGNSWNQASG